MAILGSMYLSKLVSPVVEMIMEEAVELEVAPEKVVCVFAPRENFSFLL